MKRSRRIGPGDPPNNNFSKQREELLEGFQKAKEYIESQADSVAADSSYTASQKKALLNAYKEEYNQLRSEYSAAWDDINRREQEYLSAHYPELSDNPGYSNTGYEMPESSAENTFEPGFDHPSLPDRSEDTVHETQADDQDYNDLPDAPASEEDAGQDYTDLPDISASEENEVQDYTDLPDVSAEEDAGQDYTDLPDVSAEEDAGQDYTDLPDVSASEEDEGQDYTDLPDVSAEEDAGQDYTDLSEENSSGTETGNSNDQSSDQGSDSGMGNDM